MEKNLTIRNSTAEFLIFQAQDKSQGVEVVYHDETIWATQKAMSVLFDCTTDNIGLHLKNIFASGELKKESVTEKISATAADYAKEFAETEFEKYRVIQDRLFQSDFDRLISGDDLPEFPESDR
ncbi:MAG: death-on-curing protein [Bacteroidales bacterium]|nr:death-on-curing protein [Bacteroidales bacterium]